MENVTFVEIETQEGIQTHAIIENSNGDFVSMPKVIYDAQVKLSEAKTK